MATNKLLHRLGIRYGSAVVAVAIASLLHQLLSRWVNESLPPYITFFPALMLVAILAGLGPGLVATGLATCMAAYWLLPPAGYAVFNSADFVGLAIFSATGVFLTAVAEMYRQSRQEAASLQMQEALRENQEWLRLAQEAARVGSFDWNIETGVNNWTPELEAMHGIAPGMFAQTRPAWEQIVHSEDRERVVRLVQQSLETGEPTEGEWRVIWPDGSVHWLFGRWKLIRNASGKPMRITGVNIDVTERKRSEEMLRKLNRALRALGRSNQAAMRSADEGAYLHEICRIIVEDCGHAMVWIGLAEQDEAKTVRPVAYSGFEQGYLEALRVTWSDTERGRGPTGAAIRTGTVCCCRNMLTDPQFEPWRDEAVRRGYASSVALPLISQGRTFGALTIYSREADSLSEDEIQLMSEVAADLSAGIAGFRLREESRRAEADLRQSQRQLSAIVDSIADGFYVLDHHWRFTHVNDAALRYFEKSRLGILGRSLFEIFPATRASVFETQYSRAMSTGEPVHFETASVVTSRTVEMHAYPGPSGLTVLFRDVTERKRADETLRESEERLRILVESERAARSEAERANRLKDEFLANLSHELRTPLNAILGWARILQKGQADAGVRHGLDVIERNTRIQNQLISDLLDMSRIVSGKLRLDVAPCDVETIIDAAIDSLEPAAQAKGIAVGKAIEPSIPAVLGDPGRLQQAFWNLLSNAIKFTPSGGSVRVVTRQEDSRVEVSVTDTGRGISPDFLPYVFERFRQADSSATRKHGGLGLGLSIVKHVVESHGGTVTAESPGEDHGATFTVSLPVARLQMSELQPDEANRAPFSESVDLGGVRVLVVDDEEDSREMMSRLLQERGAAVFVAASGSKALEILRERKPDVLIADIGMANMDGYEMMRRIRRLPAEAGGETPAVAVTAFSRAEDRTRALLAGYQAHLTKPIEFQELIATTAMVTRRIPYSSKKHQA